jgi:hypothetical protein
MSERFAVILFLLILATVVLFRGEPDIVDALRDIVQLQSALRCPE